MKRFHLFLFAVVVIGLFSCPVFAATITFTINAGTTPTPIPPQTYGSDQTLTGVVNPLYRQGGNRMTAYNWENNASNAGTDYGPNHEDWYMVPGGVTPPGMPATTLADFILGNNALGVDSLVTLQMAGYVSADGNCNCDVTITGAADTAGTYWKTVVFNGGPTTGLPNTSDNVVYMNEEIAYLLSTVGGAGTGGAKFYDLDNEPALWNSTHPLVHPSQPSCAEVSGKGITLAQVITGADPNAQILGPVAYGWSEYVNNQSAPDSPTGLSPSYGVTYLCYYLQQFNNASTTAGHRLLHYLDLHWYPEATGSNGASQVRITNDDTSYGVDVARMQAPRSLWDPGYTESSWITWGTGGPITLISRLQAAVSQYYPGTGLSFSEYQYGAGEDISGGVAQADALGVLGKYGVIACRWDDGTSDIYVNAAFNLYLNYDGAGSKFGNLSMPVSSSSVTLGAAYASRDNSRPSKMWVVAVNRDYPSPGNAVTDTANFTVSNLTAGQSIIGIRAFRFDPGSSTLHSVSPAPVTTSTNSFADSGMPGRSGTIYELTLSQSFIATYTPTPSNTPTSTPTPTASKTPTSADTSTPTSTVTSTATLSPTLTPTPTGTWYTPTPTNSPTLTSSDTSTATPSFTRTSTPSSTPTSTATFTPTSTRTSTASPSATFTPTLTPTITNTFTWTPTPSTAGVLFPNPLFSWTPVKFFYNLTAPADQVKVKIFTVSFRKIYEDDSLPTSAGQDKGTLDFGQTGLNIANGLYYVVVYFKSGGSENHQVMKLLVQR